MALMRRQSLIKFDAPLCETIVETPKPQGKEVLVRIERCGLCHSDLHIQDGYADLGNGKKLDTTKGMVLPFTLGHEIAGVVDEVGPDVDKTLIGKKKAVFPWIGCGQCRDCLNGDENLCARNRYLGVAIDGGFASHVLVPDTKYLLDYDPLPVNVAATLMCSGVTAYGALKRHLGRPRARNMLLIGLGGVGMMGLSFAQAMFKQPISVADLSATARETALKNGAAVAYDPSESDIVKRILKETEGGFHEVVDFLKGEELSIPVIPAGGIFTGSDAAAYLEEGAAAVQVATRFTISQECGLPADVKQLYIRAEEDDVEVNMSSPSGYPMRMLKSSPAIGSGIRPNCEAYGYLLDASGNCQYIEAYNREVAAHPDAKKIKVFDKTCLCTHMRNFDCWTCGHYTYRLKDTSRRNEDGSYRILSAEQIFPARHQRRDPLDLLRRHAVDLRDLAQRRPPPERILVRHHRGLFGAVPFENPIHNTVPFVPGKIDVDIRRVLSARIQEPLEEQVVPDRVHMGDL